MAIQPADWRVSSAAAMNNLANDFENLTKKYFAFLETSFGFTKRLVDAAQARYETKKVYVLIGYDYNCSYELSVDLGETSATGPAFNLGEVLRYANAPPEIPSSFQVTSTDALEQCLEKLAQALWKYGSELLRDDRNAFVRLARLRDKEGREFELESRLRYARSDAEKAWQKKNYEAVVAALAPLNRHLSPAEKKRLEYARMHSPTRIDR